MHDELPLSTRSKIACLVTIIAFAAATGLAQPAVAQGSDVAEGQRIWSGKAECPQCHGWAADGNGGLHSAGLAASLRTTQLTRDQILHDDTMWPTGNADAPF